MWSARHADASGWTAAAATHSTRSVWPIKPRQRGGRRQRGGGSCACNWQFAALHPSLTSTRKLKGSLSRPKGAAAVSGLGAISRGCAGQSPKNCRLGLGLYSGACM